MAPGEIETNQALLRIVKALESAAESLEPIAAFFATVDVMLREFPNDTDKVTGAALVRHYKQAAQMLEDEDDGEEGG